MTHRPDSPPRLRLAVGLCLITGLLAVYFLTYNGYAISRDEWFLFDATESLARRGDMRLNYEFDAYPPTDFVHVKPPPADTEPMQPLLAVPLFWAAERLPGIGLAHTVWLFNILVTALTAGTLYAHGLALGYRARAAAAVALIFGLGTIAWPYSRTFFREPLFACLALLAALLVRLTRQGLRTGRHPWVRLGALMGTLGALVFSKEAALLILPALIIEALPGRTGRIPLKRQGWIALAVVSLIVVGLAVVILHADTLLGLPQRYAFMQRAQQARANVSEMSEGIKGYLFSPGRSLWAFSPVLLVGLAGGGRLIAARRWRELAVPLAVLIAFVAGYAAVRGAQWHGGKGWGPRYLVPVTPFLALWLLPVFEAVTAPGAAWRKRAGVAGICLVSVGVQVLAALVPLDVYYRALEVERPGTTPWVDGIWQWRWSPLRVSLELVGKHQPDIAWVHAGGQAWLLPVLCAALATGVLAALGWWLRHPQAGRASLRRTGTGLALGTLLALGLGLYAVRRDPRYFGDFAPTLALLDQLEAQIRPDDVIVLKDDTYAEFFMNYYKHANPVVYTLPASPGERGSPEQTPEVQAIHPDEGIQYSNTVIFADLARRHNRLWLITNTSRFMTWAVRPVEHYLARHYFPVSELAAADVAHAELYGLASAPPATDRAWPALRVDALFGASLKLIGADIPGGTARQPGEVLPVSLLWEVTAPVPQDYTVGLFMMSPDGRLVAGRNAFPVNYFEATQGWRPGALYRDNHGLLLPDDLAPGTYELWVALYWWQQPDQRLPVTGPGGEPSGDHVMLATVTVP